jgi:hypothetical protein
VICSVTARQTGPDLHRVPEGHLRRPLRTGRCPARRRRLVNPSITFRVSSLTDDE